MLKKYCLPSFSDKVNLAFIFYFFFSFERSVRALVPEERVNCFAMDASSKANVTTKDISHPLKVSISFFLLCNVTVRVLVQGFMKTGLKACFQLHRSLHSSGCYYFQWPIFPKGSDLLLESLACSIGLQRLLVYMSGLRNWQEQRDMVFKVTEDKKNSIGFPHIYFITHHFKCTANNRLDKLLCVRVCACVFVCT